MKSYQQFFAELKRRKVFKVAALYGAMAFVLLQVAELLGQGLRLPESFMPFMTAVVLLGFPLALFLAWAFELTPDGVQKTEAATPGEIESMVAEPASRRWPSGLLALVGVAALLAGVWWAGRQSAPDTQPVGADVREANLALVPPADDDRPSLAVLPFADMSEAEDQEYFSDGMTEELLSVLARIPELRVTARTSTFAFKGRQVDLRSVGDSLGVRYLVDGSVRKAGAQLRISAQLVDARDGSPVWSEQYDRQLVNVFEIQSEIAEAVAGALRVPLGIDEASDLVTPTADLEAYDLYLAGRSRVRERGASLKEAIRLFEGAIARDSTWAPAWAGLAEAKELLGWYPEVWDDPPARRVDWHEPFMALQDESEAAARRALSLDPDLASALVVLGSIYRNRHEWDRGEASYVQALALDPDNGEAYHQYSELLGNTGRIADAVRAAEWALKLDRIPVRYLVYANSLFSDDRYDEGLEAVRAGIDLDPERRVTGLRNVLMYAYMEAGKYDSMFVQVPDYVLLETTEGQRLAAIDALKRRDPSAFPEELDFLEPWVIFGDLDRAAAGVLADVLEAPHQNVTWLWLPMFDPLHDHPQFREALELLNLEGVTPERMPR